MDYKELLQTTKQLEACVNLIDEIKERLPVEGFEFDYSDTVFAGGAVVNYVSVKKGDLFRVIRVYAGDGFKKFIEEVKRRF